QNMALDDDDIDGALGGLDEGTPPEKDPPLQEVAQRIADAAVAEAAKNGDVKGNPQVEDALSGDWLVVPDAQAASRGPSIPRADMDRAIAEAEAADWSTGSS